jgi:hypothetical protein
MTAFLSRRSQLGVFSALASALLLGNAAAQTTGNSVSSAMLDLKARVPAGEVVDVTDNRGGTIKGRLDGVTGDAIELIVNGEPRTVAAGQVKRIQWRQRDSWLTGALVGAGVGAIPGIYYLVTDPNECAGLCTEEYALIGIGALVGGLVDRAIKKKVTVYERPAEGGVSWNLLLAPVVTQHHGAVQVTLRF